jgi:polygalacturonase
MKRGLSALIITVVAMTFPAAGSARQSYNASPTADVWHANADRIPIGSTVTIQTNTGKRIVAVLYDVDDTGITFRPKSRVAEPARRLTYDLIANVSPHDGRVNIFKYIAIGAAVGGALFVMLLASAAD